MHIFERIINGHRYRIAAQSVWDPAQGRSVARQVVLGPAAPPPVADLSATQTVGTRGVGDVGALVWVAEQLDLIALIEEACGKLGAKDGPSVGELAVAVAIQRACAPGPKRDLAEFLDANVPRVSCLPGAAFTGQVFHRPYLLTLILLFGGVLWLFYAGFDILMDGIAWRLSRRRARASSDLTEKESNHASV